MQKLMNQQEAAEFLGVSRNIITKWIKSGNLKPDCKTATGKGRFSDKTLKAFKAGQDYDNVSDREILCLLIKKVDFLYKLISEQKK